MHLPSATPQCNSQMLSPKKINIQFYGHVLRGGAIVNKKDSKYFLSWGAVFFVVAYIYRQTDMRTYRAAFCS